ncbi:hypothetical protein AYI68_g7545 [Smittium mucronatum]|uniref:Uncharacterized protein n=1 Tax=Smittium mucronatum TaxID=133383 RepID=A0A1R0GNG8_9FUNG|nr:hypothetical protein AYI68_g7545 [Smittium mucronatum]
MCTLSRNSVFGTFVRKHKIGVSLMEFSVVCDVSSRVINQIVDFLKSGVLHFELENDMDYLKEQTKLLGGT